MSTPQATAIQLMLTGGALDLSKDQWLCDQFNEAADMWCDQRCKSNKNPKKYAPPGASGKFNDWLYARMRENFPSRAARIAREVVGIFARGTGAFLGTAAAIAGGAAVAGVFGGSRQALQGLAERIMDRFGTTVTAGRSVDFTAPFVNSGAESAASRAYGAFESMPGIANSQFRIRFWDGQLRDGRILEIKGPDDTFHDPSQAVDQCTASGGQPVVLSCASCKSPHCSTDPGTGKQSCNCP